jgi:hypothetical protein
MEVPFARAGRGISRHKQSNAGFWVFLISNQPVIRFVALLVRFTDGASESTFRRGVLGVSENGADSNVSGQIDIKSALARHSACPDPDATYE